MKTESIVKSYWPIRRNNHELQTDLVAAIVKYIGYLAESHGYENQFPLDFIEKLRSQKDVTSLYLRFQEDLVVLAPRNFPIFGDCALIQVKSKISDWENHSFELEPYEMSRQVSENQGINIYYVFSDFRYRKVTEFEPNEIKVPDRYSPSKVDEVRQRWPGIPVNRSKWKKNREGYSGGGSGTVFGLIWPIYFGIWPSLLDVLKKKAK